MKYLNNYWIDCHKISHIYVPLRMNCYNVIDPLTFHLAPSSDQTLPNTLVTSFSCTLILRSGFNNRVICRYQKQFSIDQDLSVASVLPVLSKSVSWWRRSSQSGDGEEADQHRVNDIIESWSPDGRPRSMFRNHSWSSLWGFNVS